MAQPPTAVTIAYAEREDADALAKLSRSVFIQTFVHEFGIAYPPHDLSGFLAEHHSPDAYRRHLANPLERLWTAKLDGHLAGFAAAGPNTLPHTESEDGEQELYRLYVAPDHQGAGVASRLMDAVMDWAPPGRSLWLSVWSENIRAQRFYHRYGFAKAGEYGYRVGESVDREFIYRRLPG